MKYVISERENYERRIAEIETAQMDRCAGGVGDNGISRLRRAIELFGVGVESEDVRDGLMVGGKIVVAVKSEKFRLVGNYDWKKFRSVNDIRAALERT